MIWSWSYWRWPQFNQLALAAGLHVANSYGWHTWSPLSISLGTSTSIHVSSFLFFSRGRWDIFHLMAKFSGSDGTVAGWLEGSKTIEMHGREAADGWRTTTLPTTSYFNWAFLSWKGMNNPMIRRDIYAGRTFSARFLTKKRVQQGTTCHVNSSSEQPFTDYLPTYNYITAGASAPQGDVAVFNTWSLPPKFKQYLTLPFQHFLSTPPCIPAWQLQ